MVGTAEPVDQPDPLPAVLRELLELFGVDLIAQVDRDHGAPFIGRAGEAAAGSTSIVTDLRRVTWRIHDVGRAAGRIRCTFGSAPTPARRRAGCRHARILKAQATEGSL
ncbi:hypothetical protein GCM10025760_18930 [Microbacterium yannicii]|uniref:Uncharacterized protein n=1 Tax=Microbacterium yannicii TaxID=671622 RepID=A0ABP9M8H9_9MICO